MSAAAINAKVTEAVTAIEAADYATALTKLLSAKALLVGQADAEGPGGVRLEWDRSAIDGLIAQVKRQQSAAGGIQRTKVTYKRTTLGDCD